jgi:hypothetical protein
MLKRLTWIAAAAGLALLMTACSVVSQAGSYAPTHPEQLPQGRPTCSDCHGTERVASTGKSYSAFDHTAAFVADHRIPASQDPNTCAVCHSPSFCADCHSGKTPIQPATRLGDRPDRMSPHPANYLVLHKIEGKIDPTGCYECHGRANNQQCSQCHS